MANVPRVVSNKLLKVNSYASFSRIFNESIEENSNELIIFTANGMYRGKLKIFDSDEIMKNLSNEQKLKEYIEKNDYASMIRLTYLDYAEKTYSESDQNKPFDNGITITLEDVTLTPTGLRGEVTMPFVDIFVDQIIGVSIGSPQNNNS